MIEIDRSRVLSFQSCPRKRYYEYHHLGRGIQRKSKSLPLMVGAAFHSGAEELLRGDVETACYRAMKFLVDAFKAREVSMGNETFTDETLKYSAEEQVALAEGLIRAWGLARLPEFLSNFIVCEVEREGRAPLTDDLILLYRPDALVQDRASGDHYIVSWKTTSNYSRTTLNQSRTDMQAMSEVYGRLNDDDEEDQRPAKIEGVIYLFITKGQRRLDKWDQTFKQDSKLIYGWKKLKPLDEFDDQWSWAWEYPKEDGSGNSTLGKGWKKMPIWREYPGGVKQWVTDLHEQKVFPRHVNALEEIFPQQLPVERRADEVERWKTQVIAQESRVHDSLLALSLGRDPEDLDWHFPQHSHSCFNYNSPCAFLDTCWNGVPPEPGELYQLRTVTNHPELKGDDDGQ